jgi:hypothetical protein
MPPTFVLTGVSGQTYLYQTYNMAGQWSTSPGLYAFAGAFFGGIGSTTVTRLLYIGQCDSFQRRMQEHQRDLWKEATRLGATHVLARVNVDEASRLAEEKDLIRYYNPILNTQHRVPPVTSGASGSGLYALTPPALRGK